VKSAKKILPCKLHDILGYYYIDIQNQEDESTAQSLLPKFKDTKTKKKSKKRVENLPAKLTEVRNNFLFSI